MSVKLDSLIEKIKADGVEAAKKQADEILADAKKEAEKIVKDAQKKSGEYQKNAEAEAKAYQKNAEKAIQQAARDTVLKLKEKITAIFERVLLEDVDKAMDKDF
ncbi:MAG: HrpE/YscL family type III secretion apparatus protein [Candidatus Marinimicrobia bacterium]|nr:HrpE/YscL family type III secretion apparatus protein [Candidatus Neomarinimicrobiota bacterium]